jgi:hypothetical protein
LYLYPSYYLFYIELSIPISCVPISASISKSVIISSSSPILTSWLYALYRLAVNVIFTALNLILNCPGLKLAIAVYRGLPTRRPLPCVPYDPYIPIRSSNIVWRRFWPVKAWDGWPSPLVLKVGNAGKAPASP